jgi:hypothetical protein
MRELKQSTAANVAVFMADSTDHVTGKTGLTLTITASKDAAAFGSISPVVTELANGWYKLALTTSHTDTLGDLAIHVTGTGADPTDFVSRIIAWDKAVVSIPAVAAGAAGGLILTGASNAGATTFAGGMVSNITGNVTGNLSGSVGSVTAAVLLSAGTGTGQLDFTSGVVKANLAQILGTALTETAGLIAAGFKKFFNVATPTGTVNSLPDAAPAAVGGLIALGVSNGGVTATTFPGGIVSNITGNLSGSIGTVTANGISSSSFVAGAINSTVAPHLDADVSSRLATSGYTAPDNATIATINGKLGIPNADVSQDIGSLASSISDLTNNANGISDTVISISNRIGSPDSGTVGGDLSAINNMLIGFSIEVGVTAVIRRPESSSTTYTVELRCRDHNGSIIDADATPTITATGSVTGSLSANLGAVDQQSGVYRSTYTCASTHNIEQIRFNGTATIGGTAYTGFAYTTVTGDAYARVGAAGAGLTAVGDTRLSNLDLAVSTRLAASSYSVPPSAAAIDTQLSGTHGSGAWTGGGGSGSSSGEFALVRSLHEFFEPFSYSDGPLDGTNGWIIEASGSFGTSGLSVLSGQLACTSTGGELANIVWPDLFEGSKTSGNDFDVTFDLTFEKPSDRNMTLRVHFVDEFDTLVGEQLRLDFFSWNTSGGNKLRVGIADDFAPPAVEIDFLFQLKHPVRFTWRHNSNGTITATLYVDGVSAFVHTFDDYDQDGTLQCLIYCVDVGPAGESDRHLPRRSATTPAPLSSPTTPR